MPEYDEDPLADDEPTRDELQEMYDDEAYNRYQDWLDSMGLDPHEL